MNPAYVLEAMGDGPPYFAAEVPRLSDPELRSRVVGYLAAAPVPTPGWRTDGSWAWPESLVDDVRSRGVGPRREFLDDIAVRDFVPPAALPPSAIEQAVALAGDAPEFAVPSAFVSYLAGAVGRGRPATWLIRIAREPGGVTVESDLGPDGWERGEFALESRPSPMRLEEISTRAAADLADQIGSGWHERLAGNARETDIPPGSPRLARVFDGQSPSGTPWFSPNRLRILESYRRERLATYLTEGRLVIRATARMADPLRHQGDRVVPLNYRTDGIWVWQESLAYYVRALGVAPELDLLCHIEEAGFRLPSAVPDHLVSLATNVVRNGARPARRQPPTYYRDQTSGRLVRASGGDVLRAETLSPNLRWRRADDLWRDSLQSRRAFREITEAEAVQLVDDRWAASKG